MSIYGAALRELEQYRRMKRRACCFVCRSPGATVWRVQDNPACHYGSGRPRNSSLAE